MALNKFLGRSFLCRRNLGPRFPSYGFAAFLGLLYRLLGQFTAGLQFFNRKLDHRFNLLFPDFPQKILKAEHGIHITFHSIHCLICRPENFTVELRILQKHHLHTIAIKFFIACGNLVRLRLHSRNRFQHQHIYEHFVQRDNLIPFLFKKTIVIMITMINHDGCLRKGRKDRLFLRIDILTVGCGTTITNDSHALSLSPSPRRLRRAFSVSDAFAFTVPSTFTSSRIGRISSLRSSLFGINFSKI